MVEAVFELADDRVTALMTPRPDVVWLDVEDPPERLRRRIVEGAPSRFPVSRAARPEPLGVVRAKDLLAAALAGRPLDLGASLRPPLLVPESTPALRALERFREAGEHLALVVDEYGGTAGLLTVQDVLEAIVGDLPAGGAAADRPAVRREDGSWLLDGGLAAAEVAGLLATRDLPGEVEGDFDTLGGFVLARLGRIPAPGDRFAWGGWRFEVVDMDGRRVDKVLATPVADGDDATA
jgi:putative hemolysin